MQRIIMISAVALALLSAGSDAAMINTSDTKRVMKVEGFVDGALYEVRGQGCAAGDAVLSKTLCSVSSFFAPLHTLYAGLRQGHSV